MTTYDQAVAKAAEIGREYGTNAASWFFDGNTATEHYATTLVAIEEGDPQVYDLLPAPDLSGEGADGYTMRQLAEDCDVSEEEAEDSAANDLITVDTLLADAYEAAFSEAVEAEIVRVCQYQLAD
jgi:hypothetical protein